MTGKIRLGIVGYGNLGKGAELAIAKNPDMELVAVFTRREPAAVKINTENARVLPVSREEEMAAEIDVMVLCGGSATDLPEQGPMLAGKFNTVDSFDTHAKIPEYYSRMDAAASAAHKVSIISIGWDPGLFSLNRMLAEAFLPAGRQYTFWGRGVSQGHSDAIRRIPGVKYGIQYTIPVAEALERVRSGENPVLTVRDRHIRDCYVVAEPGTDKEEIARTIRSMPHYFAEYETRVTFVTEEEFKRVHTATPHGGCVIHSGNTGACGEHKQLFEFSLKLDSNPEFTAGVLVAYARAACRLYREGQYGAKTIFDVPPAFVSPWPADKLRRELL